MIAREFQADRGDAGRRLDLVVQRHVHDVADATRTRIQRWVETGRVRVNGTVVTRTSTRVAIGDAIGVTAPDAEPRRRSAPENLPLTIVHEDAYLLAVDKPAGLVVHPAYGNPSGTLMNGLLWRARDWPATDRPSLVGRIDKLTSGLVLVAKSAAMHAALQRTAMEKSYLALCYGHVNAAHGSIDLRLSTQRVPGRTHSVAGAGLKPDAIPDADPKMRHSQGGRASQPFRASFRRVIASADRGAPSVTRFERLARVRAPRVGLVLLRCSLVTGRRHQIRAHLAACGWPIVGDPVYGEPRWSAVIDPQLAAALRDFPRQALHAWRLDFTHPISGERIRLEAPVPEDLQQLLATSELAFALS